jgi:hypothetical protein
MAQVVSRLPLAAKARDLARVSPRGIFGGQSGIGRGFLRVFRFLSVDIISSRLHTHIILGITVGGRSSETWSHPIDMNMSNSNNNNNKGIQWMSQCFGKKLIQTCSTDSFRLFLSLSEACKLHFQSILLSWLMFHVYFLSLVRYIYLIKIFLLYCLNFHRFSRFFDRRQAYLIRITRIFRNFIGSETGYPKLAFSCFPESLKENVGIVP